jgi:hypothetical protein
MSHPNNERIWRAIQDEIESGNLIEADIMHWDIEHAYAYLMNKERKEFMESQKR